MNAVLRFAGLLFVAVLAFAAWGYAQQFTAVTFFAFGSPRPYSEKVSSALIGALAAAVVASFPLALLYRQRAWVAALLVAAPVAALRIPEAGSWTGPLEQQVKLMGIVETGSYLLFVVFGAWLVSRRWPRSNTAFKSRRSSSAA